MKKNFFIFALLIFVFAGANLAQAQQKSHTLRGVVKNQDSEVITGARMIFKASDRETIAFSDINGEFTIALAPGNYESTVSRTISEKFIAFINIQENGLNPDFIELIVETDSTSADCPKIINFVKPIYPQAARAVRAMGEVLVEVKIDKEGNVTSAKAVSGHPLLRAASEQAALKSTFETSENNAERSTRLIYSFYFSSQTKKSVKRYSAPCRMEVVGEDEIIDVSETK